MAQKFIVRERVKGALATLCSEWKAFSGTPFYFLMILEMQRTAPMCNHSQYKNIEFIFLSFLLITFSSTFLYIGSQAEGIVPIESTLDGISAAVRAANFCLLKYYIQI